MVAGYNPFGARRGGARGERRHSATAMTMSNCRVIFLLDPFPFPSGGAATIYRHAEILADHGIPAFVALPQKPAVDFYASRAPLIIHGGGMPTQSGDVFVVPEGFQQHVEVLKAVLVKRIMFCQNQYYLPFRERPGPGASEFGVHTIVASSEAVRTFFRDVYDIADMPLIPYAIDPEVFSPATVKHRQIAFMPRKLGPEVPFLEATFRRRHRRHADVPWVAIDNVTQRQAAAVMAESAVFLVALAQGVVRSSPLEAMASGCLVAGFHGDGGREYMTTDNGWWAETGDWKACVDGLAAALDLLEPGGPALAARSEAMAATVARYSPARLETALLAFWREELARKQ